jgi:hypothetical protein
MLIPSLENVFSAYLQCGIRHDSRRMNRMYLLNQTLVETAENAGSNII